MNLRYIWVLYFVFPTMLWAESEKRTFTVTETAGLRRFGYPVEAVLDLPRPITPNDRFRLLDNGKPVNAQITTTGEKQVTLDFSVNLGPEEKKTFLLEYGPDAEPVVPKGSMKLESTDSDHLIYQGNRIYTVPRDLKGLLRSVKTGKDQEYLRPTSPGLLLFQTRDQGLILAEKSKQSITSKVLRSGPLAVALRFSIPDFASQVDVTVPASKSWIRFDWTVTDRMMARNGLGAELHLQVEGNNTLVEFGTGSYIYTTLKKGESTRIQSAKETAQWEMVHGPKEKRTLFAKGRCPKELLAAEGWAHIMDAKRATALAIDSFIATKAKESAEMTVDADGTLRLARFSEPSPERLTFWLHFVSMPVQIGALTSPQSMLQPLQVRVENK